MPCSWFVRICQHNGESGSLGTRVGKEREGVKHVSHGEKHTANILVSSKHL